MQKICTDVSQTYPSPSFLVLLKVSSYQESPYSTDFRIQNSDFAPPLNYWDEGEFYNFFGTKTGPKAKISASD